MNVKPSCDQIALANLFKCVLYNGCANGTEKVRLGATVFQCMESNCKAEFTNLVLTSGEKYLSCVTRNSPQTYFTRCTGEPSTNIWNTNKLGLLLLSRKALSDTNAVEFYPDYTNVFPQGYLQAKVDANNLNVVCVHAIQYLPITFEFPPVSDLFPTYADQNAFEMQDLVKRFASVEPLVLLGDMNVGPGAPSVSPLGLSNYEILTSVFDTKVVKECTFCSTNPYTGGEFVTNAILDHVLVNGDIKIRRIKVVLKPNDFALGEQNLPLSDHYGVKAVIKIQPKRRKEINRTAKMFKELFKAQLFTTTEYA
ncbi:uncharacterized protein LOC128556123 [Mercenaria mercenaria]|uniref:uncharacterized protein LOC128556123 n=1 Tax=Mercenaria mercenaria TaxID=6596 RepID=UPI00234E51AA|nr:uncharacterized protein LOC128556123 [Mercenaria mercenaria]